MSGPAGTATPASPPAGFRGRFTSEPGTRRSYARAAGPFTLRPRAVAVPRDSDDLGVLVRWARDEGRALVPRGGGTGMPAGNVGPGIAVDLASSFDGIGPVDRERRRIRVGAGALAADVNRKAHEAGLFLPPLPSSADRCTVGGMVANNAAGARSYGYGAVRDWVRELTVVLSDGRTLRIGGDDDPPALSDLRERLHARWDALSGSWPRVRKNSSGYALDRFLPSGDPIQLVVGSEGTLALITEAVLALAPRPAARGLCLLPVADGEELLRGVRAAGEVGASACEFLGRRYLDLARLDQDPEVGELARDAYALLLVEVDGSAGEVDRGLERLDAAARGLGARIRKARTPEERSRLWEVRHAASPTIAEAAERGRISMQFIEDSVVPPDRLPAYLRGLDRILADADTDAAVFGHAGDGNVHVNPLVDVGRPDWRDRVRAILERTVDLVADLGGTLSGEHGDGRLRAPYLPRIWSEEAVRAFRRVKDTLDPDATLNPGVVLPLPDQDPLEGLGAASSDV